MSEAKRDQNYVPTLLAVSSADGVTPVTLYADPTTHRLYVDLAGGFVSPLTTKGDILTYSTTDARLPVGTNGQILSADSAEVTGLKWITAGGTVTSASVVSANGFAGTVATATTTPAITLTTTITGLIKGNGTAISAATSGTDYAPGTSALATGILKSTTTTGALTIAVAGDFPTLNQNTTGSAATLTTSRSIHGGSFNGSADVTNVIASTYGGTGNGFTKFTGPTTAEKTKTLRDATDTILELGGSYTPTGTWTSMTLVTPALGTPASGTLTNCTGLPAASIVAGIIGVTGTRMTKIWTTDIESTNAPTVGGVAVPTISSTNTLTNKRITKREQTTASTATLTITSDSTDIATVTAQAVGLTIAAPTGTPTQGQSLLIRIKDNGTARALTWNATWKPIGVTLPTTTVISKLLYVGAVYNSTSSQWDVLAVGQEA